MSASYFEFAGRWFACAFDRDITERKRAEEEIRQLNEGSRSAWHSERRAGIRQPRAHRRGFERIQAEEALRHRLRFENLIAEISSDLAGRAADQFAPGIVGP